VDTLRSRKRPSRGKNPRDCIRGVYIEYGPDPQPNKRGKGWNSDGSGLTCAALNLPARRYVAILALRESGASFKEACGEVANRLQTKDKSVSKGFAKFSDRCNRLQDGQLLSLWTTMFNDWLDYTKRNFFDVGIRLGDVADRIRELSNYSKKQSGVKARLYIHHFGEQEPPYS